jgi:MYXO-CTERM domain-containing protein
MKLGPLVTGLPLVLALSAAGCGAAPDDDDDPQTVGEALAEIRGGYTDDADKAVVGIVGLIEGFGQGICTGSLIAPNVVLTAQHCVAGITNLVNGGVSCSVTGFAAAEPPQNFFVTTLSPLPQDQSLYRLVREVVVPPGGSLVCGNDQAILILQDLMPPEEAAPLVPRVDEPLVKGEEYSAIGYGATDDLGSGAGLRRRRDDLFINCVAGECPSYAVTPTEWMGQEGICQGDSGGPSIDTVNRVIGVTSRGSEGCNMPIYGYVHAWADWIKQTTIHAAELGAYDPPPWATGFPTHPVFTAPVGDACEVGGDCLGGICIDGSCSRPCTDIATCPDGYTCEGEPSSCVQEEKDDSWRDDGGCSLSHASPDPKPIPWLLGGSLAVLALRRRRRSR